MTEEFNTLEEYAKCVYDYLKIVSHDYQMASNDSVRVVYATAPVAYAKEQEHFANGSNVGPLITFYQSGIEVDHSVQMGAWKFLPVQRKEGNYLLRAPIICQIKYTVTINALTELQADLLQAQIMQTSPFHRPYYTKLNGQFVLIESSDYTNVSSVEVGDNADKISKREREYIINDLTRDIKFSSNSAKRSFMEDLANKDLKIENGKMLGFDDYLNSYKEQDAGAFVEEKKDEGQSVDLGDNHKQEHVDDLSHEKKILGI